MALSKQARKIISDFSVAPQLGDIKKRGKEIKVNHDLAMELWSQGDHFPRLLATLIFDKKLLTEKVFNSFASDLSKIETAQRNQLSDWLLANQLMKDKKLIALMLGWQNNPLSILRRWFWYYQARLRWTGKIQDNSKALLDIIEAKIMTEEPEVQWVMNFCAAWIGVYEADLRARCIKLGKKTGLYRNETVARNCTPSYLPEFIRIEVGKRE